MLCFFKQKTAYELRISDWSSDVCSSDLNQLRLSGAFNPEVVEAMIDRPVMQIQELGGEVDRAIKLPADSVGVATELPTPTPLNLIGWNAASNGLENFSPDAFVAATTAGVAHQYPVTAGPATLDAQNIVSPFGDRKSTRLNSSHSCAP